MNVATRATLLDKHPPTQPSNPDVPIHGELPVVDPIVFDKLTGDVRKAALATQGAAGPSMGDSYVWRCLLVSFKVASIDLCNMVAGVTRRLATEHVDPAGLLPLLNNQLIPLDKDPACVLLKSVKSYDNNRQIHSIDSQEGCHACRLLEPHTCRFVWGSLLVVRPQSTLFVRSLRQWALMASYWWMPTIFSTFSIGQWHYTTFNTPAPCSPT